MYKPSRYSVKSDPIGDPLGGDLRRARIFRANDPLTAAISAGGSLLGGMMSSDAATSAADTQAKAARDAAQMQQNQFNQVRSDLAPYRNLGTAAINPLLQAMGYNVSAPTTPQLSYDQIYQELLPQFTNGTATGAPVSGGNPRNAFSYLFGDQAMGTSGAEGTPGGMGILPYLNRDPSQGGILSGQNQGGSPSSGIDYAGLNAAIQQRMQQQQDGAYSNLMGNLTKDSNNILNQTFSFNPEDLTKTPGYEWNYGQGMRAVNNSAAARGLGLSGAQLKGAETFASGLADNTYQNQYNNALTQFQTNYNTAANNVNRLMSLLGIGQSSATQTGAYGMQNSANQGNYLTSGANAQASGQVGSANALSGALNGIGNNALLYSMLGKMGGTGLPNSSIFNGSVNGSTIYGAPSYSAKF